MLREQVVEYLGKKCSRCGFNKRPALEVHHRDGGGEKEKYNTGGSSHQDKFYRSVLAGDRPDIELICANCHRIEHYAKYFEEQNDGSVLPSILQSVR